MSSQAIIRTTFFDQRSPQPHEMDVLQHHKQTDGHGDSMTDVAQRVESGKIMQPRWWGRTRRQARIDPSSWVLGKNGYSLHNLMCLEKKNVNKSFFVPHAPCPPPTIECDQDNSCQTLMDKKLSHC